MKGLVRGELNTLGFLSSDDMAAGTEKKPFGAFADH